MSTIAKHSLFVTPALILSLILAAGCSKTRTDEKSKSNADSSGAAQKTNNGRDAAGERMRGTAATQPSDPVETADTQPASTNKMDAAHVAKAKKLIDDGIKYLLSQRDANGGWAIGQGARPAATAMVLKCLLRDPAYNSNSPVVKQGFKVLLSYQQPDGGIYIPAEGLSNYNTSIALMALSAAKDPAYNDAKNKAVAFLRGLVIRPGEKNPKGETMSKESPMIGGVGYGEAGDYRPDLSNAGMWMEAMHEAGVTGDDKDMQAVLAFVTRAQNFTEKNKLAWAMAGSNDGGFIYAPALYDKPTGESKAGPDAGDRGLRSYGSMTYVGFKSMLYANVDRGDPRVQAAYSWIRKYYRLDSNPNMPQARNQQGLYYYYNVFAKAMHAWGEPAVKGLDGKEHNWREELVDALARRVGDDGSWVNNADRWLEGNKVLVTFYAVSALEETLR